MEIPENARIAVEIIHRVRRVNRRAWLAAQTHCPNTTANARARRNPPNAMDFDMVDYDARKVFTSLKIK